MLRSGIGRCSLLRCTTSSRGLYERVLAAAVSSHAGKPSSLPPRAVRPVPIKIISVSKSNSAGAEAMAGEWLAKLQRYTQADELVVRPNPKKAMAPSVAVQAEGERVLKALRPQDRVVILDERGKEATSHSFSSLLAEAGDDGVSSLVFCLGGPYGHSEAVRARGDVTVRLSACVLNHQVARVMLLEQLYRAWTILKGEPYHH